MAAPSVPQLSVQRHDDLVFDIGVHTGQDTEYYLKKGFRVVGIEANPEICRQLREKFAEPLASGQFKLVEAAISATSGTGKFYKFGTSVFGTIAPDWAERNKQMGRDCEVIDVPFITGEELYRTYGVPYYMKIDIEGADMLCIEALKTMPRPKFLSIEAEKNDFSRFEKETRFIASLGYTGFQLVQQEGVPFQRQPSPPQEGKLADHRFAFGSSGMFGRDLPQRWVGLEDVLRQYAPVIEQHRKYGDYGLGKIWLMRQLLRVIRVYPGWHDLHARLGEEADNAG